MDTRTLSRIDLNLLLALQVLLEEASVSRAADRLNITQPAMSKTLSRLRDVFDDPLFTRSGRGIQPTPRAQALAGELQDLLGGLGRLVESRDFEPAAYEGEVTLALSEYIGVALLPPLIRRLHELSPRLSVRTITRIENQLEQLAQGNLDFGALTEESLQRNLEERNQLREQVYARSAKPKDPYSLECPPRPLQATR